MCELMGISFSKPLSADFSIRTFALRDEENVDGWGLGWYPDQSASIVKEPVRWSHSPYATFLEDYQRLRSTIYVAHVRHRTSGGEPTHSDTHPFSRELGGREYLFAHNGTLANVFEELTLTRYFPIGNTDSEHFFCHLLGEVSDPAFLATKDGWRWLAEQFTAANELGRLNCVLTDGQRLFCYRDARGFEGLSYRRLRIPDHHVRRLEDTDFEVDLESEAFSHGWIVATRPLSRKHWHPLESGEMLVLENGVCRYSSRRTRRELAAG